MTIRYIDSVEALRSKYPNVIPLASGKNRIHHNRQYTNIGTEKKSHGGGWQFGRTTMALGATALSLLLVPLAFKKYRAITGRLWKEGYSGSEKISLYFNSNDIHLLQTYSDRKKALDSVRKNGDNYSQIDPKYRDEESLLLDAIKTASINLLPYASLRLQESKTVALALVRKNGDNFQHLSNALRDDEEIFLAASNATVANLLPFASTRLRESKSLALKLINHFAMFIIHSRGSQKVEAQQNLTKLRELYNQMPDSLKNDTEVKAAYKENKKALKAYINRPEPVVVHVPVFQPEPLYIPKPVFIPEPVFVPRPVPRTVPVPVSVPVSRPATQPATRSVPVTHPVRNRPAAPHSTHTPVRTFR